jgi:hypothetical protein
MIRVTAASNPADMVYFHVRGDFAYEVFIGHPMNISATAIGKHRGITVTTNISLPKPAAIIVFHDIGENSLVWRRISHA